jgi:CDP-glucose 4,6-dehydratase
MDDGKCPLADLVKAETGPGFWHGKSVFLTGHTGFKGSWLSLLLARFGASVHGYALAPLAGSTLFDAVERSGALTTSTINDVRDMGALEEALSASAADVVIHMAAQPLVRLSYVDPIGTYATNVMGTVHLLDAIRRQESVRATVVVTSDKCYENREWFWGYRETEAMGGYDPYSNSKGCAELVTAAFRQSYSTGSNNHIGSGRAGNVIGGGDISPDRLIPDLIRSYRAGLKTLIRNPDAVRPWQHVLEPLTGYLRLAEKLAGPDGQEYADGWNFGPDATSERTVRDIAEASSTAWGLDASWSHDRGDHPHEASYLKLDSSKARRLLGWRPVWGFEDTIKATIDWYAAESNDRDMIAFTQNQISDYLAASAT